MEEQIVELVAQPAGVELKITVTKMVFAETFFVSIPLMILFHFGFLGYEMCFGDEKCADHWGEKYPRFRLRHPNIFFDWCVYWAFPTGFDLSVGPAGLSGAAYANAIVWGQSAQYMGLNIADQASGVFYGAFELFVVTTASIMSGAVIERIQTVGFVILAIVLGSFAWVIAAAWGWRADGWLVTKFGVHDFGAAGLVHAVAGFFCFWDFDLPWTAN